jgi:hypothetical protein
MKEDPKYLELQTKIIHHENLMMIKTIRTIKTMKKSYSCEKNERERRQ